MKELEELYTDISNSINRGHINTLKDLLLKSNLIDVTQDECDFFYLPIERDQPEIVLLLLDYFFQKQLSKYTNDSFDYIILLKTLRDHITDWTTEYGRSEEMQKVLSLYIDDINDNSFEDRLNDSLLNEIDLPVEREDGNNTILTEEVLKDFQEQIKTVDKSSPTYTASTHDNHHDNDNQEVKIGGDHDIENL